MVDKKRMDKIFSAVGLDMERHTTPIPSMPLFTSGVCKTRLYFKELPFQLYMLPHTNVWFLGLF